MAHGFCCACLGLLTPRGRATNTRPIRGLIVVLLFRQAFLVLRGSQGLETPAFHAHHFQLVNGSCDRGNLAPLAGSVQSLDGVAQCVPRLNSLPCVNSTPMLEKRKGLAGPNVSVYSAHAFWHARSTAPRSPAISATYPWPSRSLRQSPSSSSRRPATCERGPHLRQRSAYRTSLPAS